MALDLLPHHQALLAASAITDPVAAARGYRSAAHADDLRPFGFGASQRRPGLLIPIRGVDGPVVTHQLRPDRPRLNDAGKPVKYETPRGGRLVLDVPPSVRPHLGDPAVELWITEGARKVDSAVSNGIPCVVGLMGVWGFRGTNAFGGKTELADWSAVALNGRDVFVAFDSDVMTKAGVRGAIDALAAFLDRKGARVRYVLLPDGRDGI